MDKRYQVFVSSTYADLQEERQKVIQALMEMDCIPAGMELFPAADDEQWEFIKRVIQDCDYYILIIGGRYGSMTPDGISYTEKEYDYAISRSLKVLAFVHGQPGEIAVNKSDVDPDLKEKLGNFRTKVRENRLVKFWGDAKELPGLVALSLQKTIKIYPAVGWMRADHVASDELLSDINDLRKENAVLCAKIEELQTHTISDDIDLASLDDVFEYTLTVQVSAGDLQQLINAKATWGEIFSRISPDLLQHPNDNFMLVKLSSSLYRKQSRKKVHSVMIDHDDFQSIKVQFSALNLIALTYSPTVAGTTGLFWNLTKKGERLMMQLRTVKRASNDLEAPER